ncbi:HAD family hydrolase [Candidatus Bathyarchaeota archaeon]|nr:HAD family hydrolase [Candidatus Bathyarchaeota archaeon]
MIKAFIFDYGGTLAQSNTRWGIMSEKAVERLSMDGVDVTESDFQNAVMDTVEWRRIIHREGKEVDSHEFFNHALGILGQTTGRDTTDELEMYVYESTDTEWLADLDTLLASLSESHKIALLSNAWLEAPRQILRDKGWGRWFDVMVCSYDIGIPKPDPRIFQHALNLLEIDASEAAMVGDSIKADIKGAINAGMEAIWVDNEGTGEWKGHSVLTIDELPELLKKI